MIAIALTYPQPMWLVEADRLHAALAADHPQAARALAPFLLELPAADLLELQERYVETFDRVPEHSLYLLEHLKEESGRGARLSALVEHYRERGLEIVANELPDYLPLFLEYLSLCAPADLQRELAPFAAVIATLHERLTRRRSAYAAVFDALALLVERPGKRGVGKPFSAGLSRVWKRSGCNGLP